jgi:hypothetical protein
MGDENMELHLDNMKGNNQLLFECDILTTIKQALNHGCHQLETSSMYVLITLLLVKY